MTLNKDNFDHIMAQIILTTKLLEEDRLNLFSGTLENGWQFNFRSPKKARKQ